MAAGRHGAGHRASRETSPEPAPDTIPEGVTGIVPDTSRPRSHDALRGDIQGLRAIAVLLVVFGHAGLLALTGGYVGVDVFFVISGFLITGLLLRDATTTGRISLVGFYGKRARRILPAATITLVATAIVTTALLPFVRAEAALKDIAWAAVFAVNIHFGNTKTDYFSAKLPPSPVQHFWSLSVEEQFYLFWPALMILVLVIGARRSATVATSRLPRLALTIGVLSAASLAWSVYDTSANPTSAYFSTFTRTWELGLGALLAISARHLTKLTGRARGLLSFAGVAAVVASGFWYSSTTAVPGYAMLLPVLGAAALIAAGTGVGDGRLPVVSRVLGRQPLRWFGDISYGLYLWHWPMLILGKAYVGHKLTVPQTLLVIAISVVLAWLSYVFVENPIRRARALSRRPRLALVLWPAAVACLVIATVGSHVYIDHQRTQELVAAKQFNTTVLPASKRAPRDGNPVHDALAEAIDRATLKGPQEPVAHIATTNGPWLDDATCLAEEQDTSSRLCSFGDTSAKRTIVAMGDSHMLMWIPALERVAQRQHYKLIPITKLGCTPYEVDAWKIDEKRPYTQCNQWRAWALQQVAKIKPDLVVVGSASVVRSADPATGKKMTGGPARSAWQAGAGKLAQELTAITPNVEFLQDVNRLPFKPYECLSDLSHTAADCTFKRSKWVTRSNTLVETGIKETSARFVHVRDLFCVDNRCPTVINDIDVYSDDNHITPAYARYVQQDLARRLKLPA